MSVVSDGDSNTHSKLNEVEPYGDVEIEKMDCINHVHKRDVHKKRARTKKEGKMDLAIHSSQQ